MERLKLFIGMNYQNQKRINMYILVALQAVAALGTNLFWQPIGEFESEQSCKSAIVQMQKAKQHKEDETYVCLKK